MGGKSGMQSPFHKSLSVPDVMEPSCGGEPSPEPGKMEVCWQTQGKLPRGRISTQKVWALGGWGRGNTVSQAGSRAISQKAGGVARGFQEREGN